MARNKHHWKSDLAADELAHQRDSIGAWQAHIGHDTANLRIAHRGKKIVGRFVSFDAEAKHAEHFTQCVAHRLLIVDHEYSRPRQGALIPFQAVVKNETRSPRPCPSAARCARRGPRRSKPRLISPDQARRSSRWLADEIAARQPPL